MKRCRCWRPSGKNEILQWRQVRFHTVNLQEYCNGSLDDRRGPVGWFGRKGENLEALPRGRLGLADVTYHVVDYALFYLVIRRNAVTRAAAFTP